MTQYIRKNHSIKNMDTGETKTYDSIAEAKRASRYIQVKQDSGLGRGSVRALKPNERMPRVKKG